MLAPRIPDLSALGLSRRWFLAGSAALALPLRGRAAWALAADTFTLKIGAAELIVMSDGHLTIPASVFSPTAPKEELDALLTSMFGSVPETFTPATNPTLIRTGEDLILFDTGSGANFQPTAGKLMENLKANDIDPASVTKVVFTHAHPDHIWCTLAADGTLAFPNAAYYAGAAEWDFWMDPDLVSSFPDEMKPFALGAQRDLGAVKDRVTMVKDGDMIAPGISVIEAMGHTPGHLAFLIEGDEDLILTADAIPNEIISVGHPDWAFGFDADPDKAITTRKALLDRAATDKTRVLGFHFTYPGVGRIEKADTGFRFVAEG
jgi:glyoxylase-like metal-dependent hydrolase (beta-lactamase superfamily II)